MTNKRYSGFTLIELLVVISIIALLLSIVMPTLTKAKDAARTVVCLSNLKQWGYACNAFALEHKDKMPDYYGNMGGGEMGNGQWWLQSMRPYYQDPKVRFCANVRGHWDAVDVYSGSGSMKLPNWDVSKNWVATFSGVFRGKEGPVLVNDPYKGLKEGIAGSYGVNGWLMDASLRTYYGNASDHWGRLSAVKTPDRVPLLGDAYWVDGWPAHGDTPQDRQFDPSSLMIEASQMQRFLVVRHGKYFSNWAFVDGHAEKVNLRQLWSFRWGKAFQLDNSFTRNNGAFGNWKWLKNFPKND